MRSRPADRKDTSENVVKTFEKNRPRRCPQGRFSHPTAQPGLAARGESLSDADLTGLALLKTQLFGIASDFYHGRLGVLDGHTLRDSALLGFDALFRLPSGTLAAQATGIHG